VLFRSDAKLISEKSSPPTQPTQQPWKNAIGKETFRSSLREELFGKPDSPLKPGYMFDDSGRWCDYCTVLKQRATICNVDEAGRAYFCKKHYENHTKPHPNDDASTVGVPKPTELGWTRWNRGICDVRSCVNDVAFTRMQPSTFGLAEQVFRCAAHTR
jgi:hypothetical protein